MKSDEVLSRADRLLLVRERRWRLSMPRKSLLSMEAICEFLMVMMDAFWSWFRPVVSWSWSLLMTTSLSGNNSSKLANSLMSSRLSLSRSLVMAERGERIAKDAMMGITRIRDGHCMLCLQGKDVVCQNKHSRSGFQYKADMGYWEGVCGNMLCMWGDIFVCDEQVSRDG